MFGGVGNVCDTEVTGEEDDEPEEVDPGTWIDAREEEFEESEDAV